MFQLNGRTLDVARTAVHYFMFAILESKWNFRIHWTVFLPLQGLIMSIPGPTLIDLRHSSGTDSHSISFIFTARSIGYLIGSLSGGIILDCMKNDHIALIISSLIVATGAYTIPWCRNLTALLGTFIVTGFAIGFSNTGSNASCIRIWGKKGAPILQGLHFAYGCGGFFAPLLAAPFLSTQIPITNDLMVLEITQNNTNELLSESQNSTKFEMEITPTETVTIPTITVAYTIVGILSTLAFGCFVFVEIFSSQGKNTVKNDAQVIIRDPGLSFTIVVVILACLQTGLISGVEVSFAQMLTSYVVKSTHNLSKVIGSYMTSVYWGTFTVTRAISIILACRVSVKCLLIFDLILSVTAALLLLMIGTWSVPALWIGTALLGVGVASIFPASLSWIEKYIDINNRIASSFTLVSSVLEMTVPLSISMYLASQPNILFYFMTAATITCCILFVSLNIILARKGEKYVGKEKLSKEKETKERETEPV